MMPMALVMKKPRRARLSNAWWVGRDWLRRNCVFELATNGLKEVVALQNPI
jgi:hypothetical protein